MTPAPNAVQAVIDALNQSRVAYFVTGSLVTSTYGEPRYTADADFIVDVRSQSIEPILAKLKGDFDRESQMSLESVTGKTIHRLFHRSSGFTVELFEIGDDPHDQARMQRRLVVRYYDRETFFPTVEDSLIAKLRWSVRLNRLKDRDDIVKVLAHRWDAIDWPYLERWAAEHGTTARLDELKAEAKRGLA